MYNCNKCQKKVNNKKELYKGMCEQCYKKYLLTKIENLNENDYIISNNIVSFKYWLKKIFKKKDI